MELMNDPDIKLYTSSAKLVTIDRAKLDFTKSISSDECRVWVLREANPFL